MSEAPWIEVACLVTLNNELWSIAPNRDMGASGTIGNEEHRLVTSDHNPDETGKVPIHDADKINEVHALDVDVDLRVPGLTMAMIVEHILARCRSGAENRLRYIIFDHVIYEASNGWRERTYPGEDPHTNHAHFSASYDTAREADTRSWRLEEIPVALTADDKKWIADQLVTLVDKTWAYKVDVDVTAGKENLQPTGSVLRYGSSEHHQIIDGMKSLAQQVADLAEAVASPPPAG